MLWARKFEGIAGSSSLPCWGNKVDVNVIALAKGHICCNNGIMLY